MPYPLIALVILGILGSLGILGICVFVAVQSIKDDLARGELPRHLDGLLNAWTPARLSMWSLTPYEVHASNFEGIMEVVDSRRGELSEEEKFNLTCRIQKHLISKWKGGYADYNMWYVCHRATRMNILDENFEPINGCPDTNEEIRKMEEIISAGGVKAYAVYKSLT